MPLVVRMAALRADAKTQGPYRGRDGEDVSKADGFSGPIRCPTGAFMLLDP